jgi:hypothetical protein
MITILAMLAGGALAYILFAAFNSPQLTVAWKPLTWPILILAAWAMGAAVMFILLASTQAIGFDATREILPVVSAVATIGAAFATAWAAWAAQEAATVASKSLELSSAFLVPLQRAYVFVKDISVERVGFHWQIAPIWTNSGNTPTRNLRFYSCWKGIAEQQLPDDFQYPALDDRGNVDPNPPVVISFLGPHMELAGRRLLIPPTIAAQAERMETRIFVYGWAFYNDLLEGSAEYVTRYCYQIEVVVEKNASTNETLNISLWGLQTGPHNSAD